MGLYALWSLSYLGEIAELTHRVLYMVHQASKRGDRFAMTSMCNGLQAMAFLAMGEVDTGRRLAREAMEGWSMEGFQVQHYWHLLAMCNADLYEGDAEAALTRVRDSWRALDKAMLLRIRMVKVEAYHLRARVCLAVAAKEETQRPALTKEARRCLRVLEKMKMPVAEGLASVLAAGIAMVDQGPEIAENLLLEAENKCAAGDMKLFAAIARWSRGSLIGGDDGQRVADEGLAFVAMQGLADRHRFCSMLAPGLKLE